MGSSFGSGGGLIRASLLAALVAAVSIALACYSPSDLYAIEVVLNKPGVSYDLAPLANVSRIEYAGGAGYAYRSRYDPRLVVVLSEQEVFGGRHLAVRVQAPLSFELRTIYRCILPPEPGCYSGRLSENVAIDITPGEGEVALELGTVSFRATSFVMFRPELEVADHGVNLTVSGMLILEPLIEVKREPSFPTGREYRIPMPCLLSVNEPCYRIMVLIPGYDAPLRVEEGTYRVRLTLSWRSSSRTRLILLRLSIRCMLEVLPQPLERAGWTFEGGVARARVGSATISVDVRERRCEIVVPGEAELPRDAEQALQRMLESLGFRGALEMSREVEVDVRPADEVDVEVLKAALRFELEWLVKEGVVRGLGADDVAAIIEAAALGYAGLNNRLVWYDGRWIPYSRVPGASLARCAPAAVERAFTVGSPEYEQLGHAVIQREAGRRETRAPSLPPLVVAGVVALAAAAVSYVLVKKALKP